MLLDTVLCVSEQAFENKSDFEVKKKKKETPHQLSLRTCRAARHSAQLTTRLPKLPSF